MSIHIHTYTCETLPQHVAADMVPLTHVGSQYAKWMLASQAGTKAENTPEDIVWAVASRDQDFEIKTLGWVAVHFDPATGHPLLAGFVAPSERRKHLATILSAAALMDANAPANAIGVRGLAFMKIASRLGFQSVGLYRPVDDGWIVSWTTTPAPTQAEDDDAE